MATTEEQVMQMYTHVDKATTVIHESVEDAKRKRNRLAQRRHRQRESAHLLLNDLNLLKQDL